MKFETTAPKRRQRRICVAKVMYEFVQVLQWGVLGWQVAWRGRGHPFQTCTFLKWYAVVAHMEHRLKMAGLELVSEPVEPEELKVPQAWRPQDPQPVYVVVQRTPRSRKPGPSYSRGYVKPEAGSGPEGRVPPALPT